MSSFLVFLSSGLEPSPLSFEAFRFTKVKERWTNYIFLLNLTNWHIFKNKFLLVCCLIVVCLYICLVPASCLFVVCLYICWVISTKHLTELTYLSIFDRILYCISEYSYMHINISIYVSICLCVLSFECNFLFTVTCLLTTNENILFGVCMSLCFFVCVYGCVFAITVC